MARPTWAGPWLLLQSIAFHKPLCILGFSHKLFFQTSLIYLHTGFSSSGMLFLLFFWKFPIHSSMISFEYKFHREVLLACYPDWICFCSEIYVHLIALSLHSIHKSTIISCWYYLYVLLAATAKSLQSCPTLCDPIDGSPLGSPVPGILQARTLAIFSNAWKWKVKVKLLSCVWLLSTPRTAAYQAPSSMDFPGKSTGVGCHCLLCVLLEGWYKECFILPLVLSVERHAKWMHAVW